MKYAEKSNHAQTIALINNLTDQKLPHFKIQANVSTPLRDELSDAFSNSLRWDRIARFEVRKKFIQTGLGPWWTVIMHGLFVTVIWLIYSNALDIEPKRYLRHIAFGYLVWIFLSENISQGGKLFIDNFALLSQVRINYFGIVLKWLIGRVRLYAFTCLLFIPVLIFGGVSQLGWQVLTIVPAIVLILGVTFLVSYILSVLSAAFRDVPFIIPLILRFYFFATPIIWDPSRLGFIAKPLLTYGNPFFIFIELIRAPFVSGQADWLAWSLALLITVLVSVIFITVYKRFNHRIIYWAR